MRNPIPFSVLPLALAILTSPAQGWHLSWDPRGGRQDLPRWPSASQWALLYLIEEEPISASEGTLALTAYDERGPLEPLDFSYGPPDPSAQEGWILPPRNDGLGRPPGILRFRLPQHVENRELRLRIPLALPDRSRPLTFLLPWIILENAPGEPDTILFRPRPLTATVLGGVDVNPPPRLLLWSPRTLSPTEQPTLSFLGIGLDRIEHLWLERAGQKVPVVLSKTSRSPFLAKGRCMVPLETPGLWSLVFTDDQGRLLRLPRALRLLPSEDDAQPATDSPWWLDPETQAEYVVVTPDAFAGEAQTLAQTIQQLRGHETAVLKLSEIAGAFGDGVHADSTAIKAALSYAYENWRVAPLYVLLLGDADELDPAGGIIPTPHQTYDHHFSYDHTFAWDAWYGDVVASSDFTRELVVARLPATSSDEILWYRDKLLAYDARPASPVIGFVVGDANLGTTNYDRAEAAQRLMAFIQESSGLQPTAIYASDYWPLQGENLQRALDDVLALFDSGPALVEFFGNNIDYCNITHLLNAPPCSDYDPPAFRASLMNNASGLPVVHFSTCLNAAFDEWFSVPEDLLLTPDVGAVACIGRSHIAVGQADEEMDRILFENIARLGSSSLGFLLNGSLERYMNSSQPSSWEEHFTAEMTTLFGDPALTLKTPLVPRELDGSFEASGAVPRQNLLSDRPGWVSDNLLPCSGTRLVHSAEGDACCGDPPGEAIYPVAGQRMLRLCAQHQADGTAEKGAWTIFAGPATEIPSGRHTILSYWIRQERSGSGQGRVLVDLVTEGGQALTEQYGVFDPWGRDFNAAEHSYPMGQWTHVWVRLDDWTGARIASVVLRYEEPAGAGSQVLAFVDEVFVGEWTAGTIQSEENLILNGDFSEDLDADGRPDFWVGGYPDLQAPPGGMLYGDLLLLSPELESPAVVGQVLPGNYFPRSCYGFWFKVQGLGDDPQLVLRMRHPQSGAIFDEWWFSPDSTWSWEWVYVEGNYAEGPTLVEFEASSGYVFVDSVYTDYCYVTESPQVSPSGSDLAVGPNPSTGTIWIRWASTPQGPMRLRLFDVSGRQVLSRHLDGLDSDRGFLLRIPSSHGIRPASGLYLLRLEGPGISESRRILVLR
jgi:hypothetical protein